MKSFYGFIRKEFLHIFRDPRTLLILFGMPIAQIMIFGYVVTNEIKDIPIAILDQSKDQATREISNKLISSGYFKLVMNLTSLKEVEPAMKKGNVKEVIVFEPDFRKKLESGLPGSVQIIADASDPNTANLIVNYTFGIMQDYMTQYQEGKPNIIVPEVRMIYNEGLKGVYMFVPGTMALILMLISAMMTSISISREKELGTMEVLMVSPIKPFHIVVGKVIPYIGLSFINAVVIILLGFFVFELPVKGSLILLLLESLLFISLALSLGILISTVSNSQMVAMFISLLGLMLPTILLSGFIYPIENMPVILQWISNLMPPKWFIIVVKNIMIKGEGWMYIWKETLIMISMTAFFLLVAIRKFKIRLE
ncbi:MAG: ABC transporter permease [Bacteroidota bacterium]|nr:ABC transporter permease [Bacteroidota bacterium]